MSLTPSKPLRPIRTACARHKPWRFQEAFRTMRDNFMDYAWHGLLILSVVGGLYLGAYFFCVHRFVQKNTPHVTPEGSRTYNMVSSNSPRWGRYQFFDLAMKLDRKYLRRHYWSGWYEVVTTTSTNLDYDCDRRRK